MNFIEAAIELLSESSQPLHVDQICKLAVERELLSKPGKAPLRAMKGRLTTELKKGDDSRIVRVEADVWAIKSGSSPTNGASPRAVAQPASPQEAATDEAGSQGDIAEAPEGRKRRRRRRRGGRGRDRNRRDLTESGEDSEVPLEARPAASQQPEEPEEPYDRIAPSPTTPEEEEFARLYGDDLDATTPLAELREYRDSQTADEDRPMTPEIRAERPQRGRGRERSGRETGRERGRERESRNRSSEPPNIEVGTALADAAFEMLAQSRSGQPTPVRQLASMLRKAKILDEESDTTWALLKAALLTDEKRRRCLGLEPRIVHRGRDLFSLATRDPSTIDAERAFSLAAERLRTSTKKALGARLCAMKPRAFECVVQLLLEERGWRGIRWIKRVGHASYASATAPGTEECHLVGASSGDALLGRRGVGELRAGLVAKDLRQGLLVGPMPLSAEARTEYELEGRPMTLLCGDDFLEACMAASIGVQTLNAPVYYLDVDLLNDFTDS